MKPCGSRECEVREAYNLAREEDGKVEIGLSHDKVSKFFDGLREDYGRLDYVPCLYKLICDNLENLIEVKKK